MSTPKVRFDDALVFATSIARKIAESGSDVRLVRDILGRIKFGIDDRIAAPTLEEISRWRSDICGALENYTVSQPLFLATELFDADAIFGAPRSSHEPLPDEKNQPREVGEVSVLDNTVTGGDWSQVAGLSIEAQSPPRVALYGFKGGVGRSTATYMLAKHLSEGGNCVLVVDLDLESPGSGPLILSPDESPTYGIVDFLVESALGNADELDLVARAPQLPSVGNGEIWVAPARGQGISGQEYSYIDKLNRIYADAPGSPLPSFNSRVKAAIDRCVALVTESSRQPDVVLLDSRAGIHDIAAVAISRQSNLALLFGSDNQQTWTGYRDLFDGWRRSGQSQAIREKLHMVASMVPDTDRAAYLSSFRENSWDCFSVLYDDISGAEDGFNPSTDDQMAPHYPIPIVFTQQLVGVDGRNRGEWGEQILVKAAYAEFLEKTTDLILETP